MIPVFPVNARQGQKVKVVKIKQLSLELENDKNLQHYLVGREFGITGELFSRYGSVGALVDHLDGSDRTSFYFWEELEPTT